MKHNVYVYIHLLHLILQKDNDYIYNMASHDQWLYMGFSLHPVGEFPCYRNFDCHRTKARHVRTLPLSCRIVGMIADWSWLFQHHLYDIQWKITTKTRRVRNVRRIEMIIIWKTFEDTCACIYIVWWDLILQVSWCSSLLLLPLVTHQLSFLDEFTTWQTQIASANIRIHCVYLYPFWVFTLAAHGQGYRKRFGGWATLWPCLFADEFLLRLMLTFFLSSFLAVWVLLVFGFQFGHIMAGSKIAELRQAIPLRHCSSVPEKSLEVLFCSHMLKESFLHPSCSQENCRYTCI